MRYTANNEVYIKILYWGIANSGKTTMLDTLYKITTDQNKDIMPVSDLKKIAKKSGSTLYFDRGLFRSNRQKKVYYHVYTVAGQRNFGSIRKRVFEGTDGVIFVVDSQTQFLEDNIESLKELKDLTQNKLIHEIPLIIALNKQDLLETIDKEIFRHVLREEKLWYEPQNNLFVWNPLIFDTCSLPESEKNVYRCFAECARRTGLYQILGNGKAPVDKGKLEELEKIGFKVPNKSTP